MDLYWKVLLSGVVLLVLAAFCAVIFMDSMIGIVEGTFLKTGQFEHLRVVFDMYARAGKVFIVLMIAGLALTLTGVIKKLREGAHG